METISKSRLKIYFGEIILHFVNSYNDRIVFNLNIVMGISGMTELSESKRPSAHKEKIAQERKTIFGRGRGGGRPWPCVEADQEAGPNGHLGHSGKLSSA